MVLVSCRQRTSVCVSASQLSITSIRILIEFTFHVAIFIEIFLPQAACQNHLRKRVVRRLKTLELSPGANIAINAFRFAAALEFGSIPEHPLTQVVLTVSFPKYPLGETLDRLVAFGHLQSFQG